MQNKFIVEGLAGKKTLEGEIVVGGAKNAATKALAASILFEDELQYHNMPEIEDVARMRELLAVAKQGTILNPVMDKKISERMRSSIVMAGPLLARAGAVTFPFPGGCVLGERPIDLFLEGFKAMGACIEERNDLFVVTAPGKKLKGAHIAFPFVSVTATETLMLAAVLAEGETILENAAMEPEISCLAEFLNLCGSHIDGAGTNTIKIAGGNLLKAEGKAFVTPPDRIEAGSFVILAALAGKEVTIQKCEPKHMGAIITLIRHAGVPLEVGAEYIKVSAGDIRNSAFKLVSVRTHEYPGFPTDLQAPMAVFLSQATGEGMILETIFDGRFRYADDLVRMGADITVMNPHKMLIKGPRPLSRKELESPDLRGGLAYIIAAAVATGTSTISNAYVIDRGYEHIEERLQKLGLNIKREVSA
ncbi:MAG: UDP-N-acetylglucosamine 1-carboxyvinyltransferase [Minisyncoccia bacterium]|jgi:UDP-N-acetylglucosamine 1-carboxyvinyltransferase